MHHLGYFLLFNGHLETQDFGFNIYKTSGLLHNELYNDGFTVPDGGVSLAVALILGCLLQRAHVQVGTATHQDLHLLGPQ